MRYAIPRESYIPGSAPVVDPQSDAVIYIGKNSRGALAGAAFFGKQTKPAWHYTFRNQKELEAQVVRTLEARRKTMAFKAERAAEWKKEGNPWSDGDIAYTSWGYEQTNVSAYQCIETRGMVAVFRSIRCEDAGSNCSMSGYVLPVRDAFVGDPIRVMAKRGGKIGGHGLSRWEEGKRLYQSSYH